MNRSSRVAEIATTQYENAVLEAYGFMRVKENFASFCHNAVDLPLILSMLHLNDFGSARELERKHRPRSNVHTVVAS